MKVNLLSAIKHKITPRKPLLSYRERQEADILKYGAKKRTVPLEGITEEEINEITPHRRLSAKGNTLSDPEWFVKNYEKETGEEYLPIWWECVSPNYRADYVVRQRYYSLLANKIMKKIQKEPVEHSYQLYDGEIVGHAIGDSHSVNYKNSHVDVDIHNHPITGPLDTCKNKELAEFTEFLCPEIRTAHVPHSGQDIISSVKERTDSYVIDSNGGRFVFSPKKDSANYITRILDAQHLDECMSPVSKEIDTVSRERFCGIYNQKNIDNGYKETPGMIIKHYDKVGYVIGFPHLGEYRQMLYKCGVLDKLGKYKELN